MSPSYQATYTASNSINKISVEEMDVVAVNIKNEPDTGNQDMDAEPHDNDILCGRGGDINIHPGNIKFRKLVTTNKRVYLTSRFKREKRLIAERIVKDIKRQSPPGRFLTRNVKDGPWREITDVKARDKTSQALREGAPKIRQQLYDEHQANTPPRMHNRDHLYSHPGDHHNVPERPDLRDEGYNNNSPHTMITSFTERFGCPTHLSDVRDESQYQTHPHEREHHDYNNHQYYENSWDRRQYGQSESDWDQRDYEQLPYRDDRVPCSPHVYRAEQDSYIVHQPLDVNHPPPPQPGMLENLRNVLSWGSDKNLSSIEPEYVHSINNGMDCEPARTTNESGAKFDARTPPPDNEAPIFESWSDSFTAGCNVLNPFQACHSNLAATLKWSVYGEQPEREIASIESIEIDGPASSGEMRGSSLVNVFNDSSGAMSMNDSNVFPELDDSAFHDSDLLQMKFSTE